MIKASYRRFSALMLTSALFLTQCGARSSSQLNAVPESDQAFPRSSVTDIQFTLDPAEWDQIRSEGNDYSNRVCGVETKTEYSKVGAQIAIDGQDLGKVTIRKKGFLGSLLQVKPSLKVKFEKGKNYQGLSGLVLNNNNQDPSLMRQCLAYDLFSAAGIKAPRCSFARVSVNGQDLGIYTHVEEYSKAFLARNFGGKGDDLIEGTLSDFSPDLTRTFEVKEGDEARATAKIQALSDLLAQNPPDLLTQLEDLIDLENFFRFWAMEVLVGHWDGYANNRNNFYIHIDKNSGKMSFIPWGADMVFTPADPFYKAAGERPVALSAKSKLTYLLSLNPEAKKRYEATLRQMIDEVWNVEAIKARMSELKTLLGSEVADFSYAGLNSYVETRATAITTELSERELSWPVPYSETASCSSELGDFEAQFSTRWLGDINPKTPGGATGSVTFTYKGELIKLESVYSLAGISASVIRPQPTVMLVGKSGEATFVANIFVERDLFQGPSINRFQGFSTFGVLLKIKSDGSPERLGIISNGSIELSEASKTLLAPVSGSVKAKLYSVP